MNASIISVNPGKTTLGNLNPEATARMVLRRRVMHRQSSRVNLLRRRISLIFGIKGRFSTKRTVQLLLTRLAFAGLLVGIALTRFEGAMETSAIVLASLISVGLFCRISNLAVASWAGSLAVMAGIAGEFETTSTAVAIIAAALAYSGPGKYSIDAILRHALFRSLNRRISRRLAARRLSYRAYQFS